MITNEDIEVLYTYLGSQVLPTDSAIAKLYGKIVLIKTAIDTDAALRNYGETTTPTTSNSN